MKTGGRVYGLGSIMRRELRRMLGHPLYLLCMLGAPLFSALFFLSLMHKGLPTDLPLAVVDLDNSAASRALVRQLDASPQAKVLFTTASFTQARIEMQKEHIYGIFCIPAHFATEAATGKRPVLSFYTNGAFFLASSLLFRDMKTLAEMAGASVGLQQGRARGYTDAQIMGQLQPIKIDLHALGNPWQSYAVYLCNVILPGVLQLMIFLITAYSIGMEIKHGTAARWLQMGGGSIARCLAGKLLPQTGIFTLVGFTLLSLLYGYNAFPLKNGWAPMLAAMFLLVLASQSMGAFMIAMLPTPRLGLSFASLFGILSFSLAGLSFPVRQMYPSIQAIAELFPLRHYFIIYLDQALSGRSLFYSWASYCSLAAFLLLPFLTGRRLKKALLYMKYIP
ncbi:MAG: ABC transporter permease [Tannerella sp.]|jgi:ABC-2 type transport system permease protein|nr:ABC transporter permease [Tannerella sp.]